MVLLHQGGLQTPPSQPAYPAPANPDDYTDVNKCVNFNGAEMQNIARDLDHAHRGGRVRATRTSRTSARCPASS